MAVFDIFDKPKAALSEAFTVAPRTMSVAAVITALGVGGMGYGASRWLAARELRKAPGEALAPQNDLSEAIRIDSTEAGPFFAVGFVLFLAGLLTAYGVYRYHR